MPKLLRILSIDGGGIRGILPGMLLASLEKMLQERTGNPSARIAHFFDMVAGTSTGGILTCLYLCPDRATGAPRFTAMEAVDLYLSHGKKIFRLPVTPKQLWVTRKYDCRYISKGMGILLESYFNDLRLSELLKPCLITSYDMENRRSFFFTQHDARKDPGYDFYVKDLTRATSAAPGYFEPAVVQSLSGVQYTLLDGAVFANNPALCAYAEAMQLFGAGEIQTIKPADILLVSIGSGSHRDSSEVDGKRAEQVELTMAGVAETVDFQLKQLFGGAGRTSNYFRFEPDLLKASPGMDDCSNHNLQALCDAGFRATDEFAKEMERVADLLIGNQVAAATG